MKLNIFKVPADEVEAMRAKLRARKLTVIKSVKQDGWKGDFYFSKEPDAQDVAWAESFASYFEDGKQPKNLNYYAAFVFARGDKCYALSFGKTHFYLRQHSDYDFGVELAKRIANERDVKQTASRRFQGKNKKYIRSFAQDTRLDVESGESVDYLQGSVIADKKNEFGKSGKFGTSALLTVDLGASSIGQLLSKIDQELAAPARFKLPRTTVIFDEFEEHRYDDLLIRELLAPVGATDFTHNSYDLYGIDFIFSNYGTFCLRCPGYPAADFEELTVADVKRYIVQNEVRETDVLSIRVVHSEEGRPKYTKSIKESLDFIADDERVLLTNGRWMRFNQDYLDFLDEFLQTISVEVPEDGFSVVVGGEPDFNVSQEVREAGYEVADKDFDIFKTRSSTPVEAWDLKRGVRVYAVKFGTPQKLGYVCDQATAVLELLRNKAGVNKVPEFKEYCLWLGYKAKKPLVDITGTGSIIFKQKIEAWARKARELGIEPVLKISQKT